MGNIGPGQLLLILVILGLLFVAASGMALVMWLIVKKR
jgi:Sec-independent protein translocase protein TatA